VRILRWLFKALTAALTILLWATPARADWDPPTLTAGGSSIWVTGYTCPPYCAPTADGTPVGPGSAACPPNWAFGTRVLIEGVGLVTCNDLYEDDLSTRIDVFEPDDDACYQITGWHAFLSVPPKNSMSVLGQAA
jgi:3D (Asp-Asp-Asp) domain-containing protein